MLFRSDMSGCHGTCLSKPMDKEVITVRRRERGEYVSTPLPICGTGYYDLYYPYGDGPWTNPRNQWMALYGGPYPSNVEVCLDELHPGPPYKTGGPLDKYELVTDQFENKCPVDVSNYMYRYAGEHLPTRWPTSYLDHGTMPSLEGDSTWGDASQFGAAGWKKFRPTKPKAGLGVFLGEIRETPRMLKTTAKGFHDVWKRMGGRGTGPMGPKAAANHFLNTQFGWFPFLRDLRDFYYVTKNLDKHLKQVRRDNGKWIRRRGSVSREQNVEVLVNDSNIIGLFPAMSSYLYTTSNYGSRIVTRKFTQRAWFEGAFKYWIPGNPESWHWKLKAVSMLYGIQPNPSVLWNLTPWSWLVDWCSSVGDVLDNLSSIAYDGLCAKYAYVMATTEQEVRYEGTSNYLTGPVTAQWFARITRKSRAKASPFGFGLSSTSFSAKQWAILSALGLTRLR